MPADPRATNGACSGARGAVVEDIWTYDRVPGCRMVLPWVSPGLPGGHVQLDFVFNEQPPEAPEPAELPGGTAAQAATPARPTSATKRATFINPAVKWPILAAVYITRTAKEGERWRWSTFVVSHIAGRMRR